MLLTNYQELSALYPNHRLSESDLPQVQSYMFEEEQAVLIPILGYELYEQINEDYQKELKDKGGISALQNSNPSRQVNIIRDCQCLAFYRMLADNAGIFAVSFNLGGGFNVMSADNYEAADKDTKQDFQRDVWGKAMRYTEMLLLNLELDAKAKQSVYGALWKKSRYYFYQSDLLFSTSWEMAPFYPIQDRKAYIELVPTIRNIQEAYICPAIGEHIVQQLVEYKHTYILDDAAQIPEVDAMPREHILLWRKLHNKALMALGQFTTSRIKPNTPHILQDADLSLSLCTKLVKENPEVFPPLVSATKSDMPDNKPHHCDRRQYYNPNDPDNAILDLGFTAHNT